MMLVWALFLRVPGAATAQPDEYGAVIREAIGELEAERWPEAQALFERANAIYPNARALWGIGMAAFERRDYTTAVRALRAALDGQERPLLPRQREIGETMLQRSMLVVARYALVITPDTAVVAVDGSPGVVVDGELLMNPGTHEVVTRADGYRSDARPIDARPGEVVELTIVLAPEEARPATSGAGARSSSTSGVLRPLGWTTLGVGAGAGLVSIITGVRAQKRHDELSSECGGPCTEDRLGDIARGRRLARTSTALTFLSVAAIGSSVVMVVMGARREGEDGEGNPTAREDRAQLAPVLGPALVGADLSLRF